MQAVGESASANRLRQRQREAEKATATAAVLALQPPRGLSMTAMGMTSSHRAMTTPGGGTSYGSNAATNAAAAAASASGGGAGVGVRPGGHGPPNALHQQNPYQQAPEHTAKEALQHVVQVRDVASVKGGLVWGRSGVLRSGLQVWGWQV